MLVVVVGKSVCVTLGEDRLGIVVASVGMLMLSMELESVLVYGYKVRDKYWVGIV